MQETPRLADFIRAEIEPILLDWQAFATSISHAGHMDAVGLRDHAREMLLVIATDLDTHQSRSEQIAKSQGHGVEDEEESWAEVHGVDRQTSGFSVMETVSEFRALRASVVSHWTKAYPKVTGQQLDELTRFHEAIDQAVAESLEHYATAKEMETRLFGAILVASPDPSYVLDMESRFLYANRATARLFALAPQAIIGKTTSDLGFSFASDLQRTLEKVMTDQVTYRGKYAHTFASAQGEWFEYVLAPVVDEQGNTEATVCVLRDVTEQTLAEEQIWHSAHHDPLTGLPNRRLFLDRLKQEVKHAKRSGLPLAVLFMDLDGFKEVNDTFGHETGDRLLKDVAERFTESLREEDTIARLGGDEFTMILTGAQKPTDLELVARNIIDSLAMPFHIEKQPVRISVSIGISRYPQDAFAPADLMEAADLAMYKAKQSGADRLCFYDTSHQPVSRPGRAH